MRVFIFLIVAATLVIFSSCKKEKEPVGGNGFKEPEGCYNIPPSPSALGYNLLFDTIKREAPSFNPNNPDEFVYAYYSNNGNALYTYNIKTKKATKIFTGGTLNPRWGASGKIIFETFGNIFSVSAEGLSPTQLTFFQGAQKDNMYNWDWNADGSLFAIQNAGISPALSGLVITPSGVVADSIVGRNDTGNFCGCYPRWGRGKFILAKAGSLSNNGLAYIDTNLDTCIRFHTNKDNNHDILDVCWHPNGKEVYFIRDRVGIFKVEVGTGKETLVKESCRRYWHQKLDISADGTKIITGRFDDRWMAENDIVERRVITIMNIDGSNEEIVDIKE